jgi:hypothetical protein
MSLSNQINELKILVSQCESEITSLESGRKASSSRARKSLQAIKQQAHGMRKVITETTKALPTKTRVKKVSSDLETKPERVEVPATEAPTVEVPVVEPAEPLIEPVKKSRKKPTKTV